MYFQVKNTLKSNCNHTSKQKKRKEKEKKYGLRKARCSTHKEKKIHYVNPPGALCLVHSEFATPISF